MTYTKFADGAWIVIVAMPIIVFAFYSIHRHYLSIMAQLRRGTVTPGDIGENHVVLLVSDFGEATAEALGSHPILTSSRRACGLRGAGDAVPPEVQARWRTCAGGGGDLEPLPLQGGDVLSATRAFLRSLPRQPNDFVTVIIPEQIRESLFGYLLRRRSVVRLKSGLLREPNVVVTDVPVVGSDDGPLGADARALIPQRTVTLVFVSSVNDATIRAVNYAQALGAAETRAIYFDLDPDEAHRLQEQWFDRRLGIPLDIVEAQFRDLTGPMLEEVRRHTSRSDTVVNVVIPEFLVNKWRHYLLHNQNALFIKRLFLFEERAVLSSVPFVVQEPKEERRRPRQLEGSVDEAAVAFCREKCLKETTVRHLISVEGVMRALAGRFGEDPDLWGLTGLFHDLDQDHTGDEGLGHAELAASWLRENRRRRTDRERRARPRL